MFGIGQCAVEYLDDLHWSELTGIVLDFGAAIARAGLVAIDPEHAHQLPFDRFAKDRLTVENRVLELDRADALADDLPTGHLLPVAVIAHRAVSVMGRQRRRHLDLRV